MTQEEKDFSFPNNNINSPDNVVGRDYVEESTTIQLDFTYEQLQEWNQRDVIWLALELQGLLQDKLNKK